MINSLNIFHIIIYTIDIPPLFLLSKKCRPNKCIFKSPACVRKIPRKSERPTYVHHANSSLLLSIRSLLRMYVQLFRLHCSYV